MANGIKEGPKCSVCVCVYICMYTSMAYFSIKHYIFWSKIICALYQWVPLLCSISPIWDCFNKQAHSNLSIAILCQICTCLRYSDSSMGVSGKWIKALVGLKKSEKSQSQERDDNVSILFFPHSPNFNFFCCSMIYLVIFWHWNWNCFSEKHLFRYICRRQFEFNI